MHHIQTFSLILIVTALTSSNLTSAEGLPDDISLYPENGVVLNLEEDTFYPYVRNSEKSWLVLFYKTWCGHCKKYVPTYMNTADSLKVWSDNIGVSAINCAKEQNEGICRDHVDNTYPVVCFVPSHTDDTAASRIKVSFDTSHDVKDFVAYAEAKIKSQNPQAKPSSPVIISHKYNQTSYVEPKSVTERPDIFVTAQNASLLFYEDLVYGLKESLENEVGGRKEISGAGLQALKDYIAILSLHFPDSSIVESLELLNDNIQLMPGSITYDDWIRLLTGSGLSTKLSVTDDLIRCRGSWPGYRGFPCTLWSLFHTLSVQATIPAVTGQKMKGSNEHASYDVLRAMRGYVVNFFSCYVCVEHFATMAVEIEAMTNRSNEAAVLWLWDAHNRVNERLAGDETEDPNFPKLQFPSKQDCPDCKTPMNLWNIDKVYEFLNTTYTDIRHPANPKTPESQAETHGIKIEMSMIYAAVMVIVAAIYNFLVGR